MNKYALLTVAAIPGQGSGTSAFKAPEVWKGGGSDHDESGGEYEITYGGRGGGKSSFITERIKNFPPFGEWYEMREKARKARLRKVLGYTYDPYKLGTGPDEGDEEDQSEGPPSDDPYTKMADRYNRDVQALRALRDTSKSSFITERIKNFPSFEEWEKKRMQIRKLAGYNYDPYKLEA